MTQTLKSYNMKTVPDRCIVIIKHDSEVCKGFHMAPYHLTLSYLKGTVRHKVAQTLRSYIEIHDMAIVILEHN